MFTYASDREAVDVQKRLAAFEGIYAEPSAAVALVAVEKLISTARVSKGQSVVTVITGSGFRETGAIVDLVGSTGTPINADSGIELLQKLLSE
jgi:threonine synthase